MPPEIRFTLFYEEETKSYYTIHYNRRDVGTLLIDDVPKYNNVLNFRRNVDFGVEKTVRIINAIFCRFGEINFRIGSN